MKDFKRILHGGFFLPIISAPQVKEALSNGRVLKLDFL